MVFCHIKSICFSRLISTTMEKKPVSTTGKCSLPCVLSSQKTEIKFHPNLPKGRNLLISAILQLAEHLVHSACTIHDGWIQKTILYKEKIAQLRPRCPGALPVLEYENTPHTKHAHRSLYVLPPLSSWASYRISQKRIFLSKCPLITHCSVQTMSLQLDPANTVFMPERKSIIINQRQLHG